jgi:hypothetical protein
MLMQQARLMQMDIRRNAFRLSLLPESTGASLVTHASFGPQTAQFGDTYLFSQGWQLGKYLI